jgi:two-component system chemotaxis sensor kinase CheA
MEEFVQEFKAEAAGIIQRLQELVLMLEQDKNNKTLIEEIFRGVHTLKGSSRMFGFDKIEKITHDLENTFELIREGQIPTSTGVIELTFKVLDMCSAILNGNFDTREYDELLKQLGSDEIFITETSATASGVYQLLYHPLENVYERGVNPMAVINELKGIGEHTMFTLKQPKSLEEQQAARKFESTFEILLPLEKSKEELEDVFLFMDAAEYSIHELDSDPASWNDVIERAEKVSGGKFPKDVIQERKNLLTEYFKKIETKKGGVPEKQKASQEPVRQIAKAFENAGTMNFINVKLERLDDMMKLVSELVTIKAELHYRATVLKDVELSSTVERLEKVTTRFRDNAFSMRLVPLQVLSLKFQRMVRDLGDKLGKDINLLTEGLDTEIDKTIISEIEAPIMHIIRNAIDHGLETTEERRKLGKTEKGLLKIVAFYSGANVFIQIQDDGRGLNLKRIREKAISRGLIESSAALSDKEIINLIFEPGFSTHDSATEYSGRGVGMDVVKQKLKELRGSIEITTEEGLGTAFTLRLPLSLSILDVLHVKVKDINYLLPHSEVELCLSERLNQDTIQKRGFNLKYKGKLIPHLNLNTIFNLKSKPEGEPCIIVLNKNDQHVAVEVDEIVGEEQLVIKPVDEALKSLEYLSGVAVLGNGELAFLIDSLKLKESFALEAGHEANRSTV